MPYQISRVGRNLVMTERPDGSIVMKYTDEMDLKESVKILLEYELRDILSRTHKFDEFIDEKMSVQEKLEAIFAAVPIVGPIPTGKNPDDDTNNDMLIDSFYWHWILNVAQRNNWEPMGTTYPTSLADEVIWDGNYIVLGGQSIGREDTANLCQALKRGIDLDNVGGPLVYNLDDDPKQILVEFINFCEGGYLLMIW